MVRRDYQGPRALPRPSRKLLGDPSRLHDRAYMYLKGLLLDGGLEPGEIISTESVGQALAISRAPATDAIRRLTSEGFVAVLPQIGCRVRTPERAEVADFFELFALGESFVSRLAAERRSTLAAGDFARECEAIEKDLDRVASAPDASSALRELNRRRHRHIHDLAESPLTAEIVASFWDRSDFYIRVAFGAFVITDVARAAHRAIARAIVEGDGTTAESTTRDYLREVGRRVAARLPSN